jgi:crotonobetainyl-CoA:carnitine CoA-transferase CaiB-like acyl-CoA transferase
MGWDELHALNPRLTYCSISGFGQSGPYSGRRAMDPVIQAISGVMSVTGTSDGTPLMIGSPLADVISGMFAAYAIVGALHAVTADGCGRHIDLSMQAAMIATMGPRMGEALQAGISPKPLGNQNPMRVPSDVYFTRDRVPIFVMVQNDRLWLPFCRAVGKHEWISDPRFIDNVTRVKNRALINHLVTARFAELESTGAIEALEREAVPFARVYNYVEALADPQVKHRAMVHEVDHPASGRIRVVGPPWIISDNEVELSSPPTLGQHTIDVLENWLGWDAERSARFKAQLDAAEPAP